MWRIQLTHHTQPSTNQKLNFFSSLNTTTSLKLKSLDQSLTVREWWVNGKVNNVKLSDVMRTRQRMITTSSLSSDSCWLKFLKNGWMVWGSCVWDTVCVWWRSVCRFVGDVVATTQRSICVVTHWSLPMYVWTKFIWAAPRHVCVSFAQAVPKNNDDDGENEKAFCVWEKKVKCLQCNREFETSIQCWWTWRDCVVYRFYITTTRDGWNNDPSFQALGVMSPFCTCWEMCVIVVIGVLIVVCIWTVWSLFSYAHDTIDLNGNFNLMHRVHIIVLCFLENSVLLQNQYVQSSSTFSCHPCFRHIRFESLRWYQSLFLLRVSAVVIMAIMKPLLKVLVAYELWILVLNERVVEFVTLFVRS